MESAKKRASKKNVAHDEYFQPEKDTTFYQDDKARWNSDFTSQENRRRADELKRRQEQLAKKRDELERREVDRQHREEQHYLEEQQKVAFLQSGAKGRANKSTSPFDILTLEYRETAEALNRKQQDDLRRQRAQQRSHRLYELSNTVTHNIITGEPPRAFPDAGATGPV